MICPKCKKFSKKLNEIFKNKTYKSISIILLFIVLVLFIFFIKFFNKESSTNNIPEEIIYDDTYIIPENKKVIVTFIENGNLIHEEKSIDREKVKNYFSDLDFSNYNNKIMPRYLMEGTGEIYYIEYYDGDLRSKVNFYGVIKFCNYISMDYKYSGERYTPWKAYYYQTSIYNTNNLIKISETLYESELSQLEPDNIENIKNEKMLSLLNKLLPYTATEIRIGFIYPSDNTWLTDFSDSQVVTTDLNHEYISSLIESEIDNYMIENIANQKGIQVVIKSEATDEQIYNLGEQIKSIPGVNTSNYISKENTYNEIKNRLANRNELLEILDPSMVSASFIITFIDLSLKDSIQNQINKLDNIKKII